MRPLAAFGARCDKSACKGYLLFDPRQRRWTPLSAEIRQNSLCKALRVLDYGKFYIRFLAESMVLEGLDDS